MKKIISMLIILFLCIGLIGCNTTQNNKTDTNPNATSKAITLKQYNDIESGITYEEATKILDG